MVFHPGCTLDSSFTSYHQRLWSYWSREENLGIGTSIHFSRVENHQSLIEFKYVNEIIRPGFERAHTGSSAGGCLKKDPIPAKSSEPVVIVQVRNNQQLSWGRSGGNGKIIGREHLESGGRREQGWEGVMGKGKCGQLATEKSYKIIR